MSSYADHVALSMGMEKSAERLMDFETPGASLLTFPAYFTAASPYLMAGNVITGLTMDYPYRVMRGQKDAARAELALAGMDALFARSGFTGKSMFPGRIGRWMSRKWWPEMLAYQGVSVPAGNAIARYYDRREDIPGMVGNALGRHGALVATGLVGGSVLGAAALTNLVRKRKARRKVEAAAAGRDGA